MKKVIIGIILIAILVLTLTACGAEAPDCAYDTRLVCIYRATGNGFNIYVDVDTRVQYIYSTNHGGLTVRVDENGQPLLYEGELPE